MNYILYLGPDDFRGLIDYPEEPGTRHAMTRIQYEKSMERWKEQVESLKANAPKIVNIEILGIAVKSWDCFKGEHKEVFKLKPEDIFPLPKGFEFKEDEHQLLVAFGLTTRFLPPVHDKYGYGCSECCTGDRCDETCTAKYKSRRKDCPHCQGKGWIRKDEVERVIGTVLRIVKTETCEHASECLNKPPSECKCLVKTEVTIDEVEKQQHTEEPWKRATDFSGLLIEKENGYAIAKINDFLPEFEANANRIVSCVNAMAGISDPEAWVKRSRELGTSYSEIKTELTIPQTIDDFPYPPQITKPVNTEVKENGYEIGRLLQSKDHGEPFYWDGRVFKSIGGYCELDRIRSNGDYFVIPTYIHPQLSPEEDYPIVDNLGNRHMPPPEESQKELFRQVK